MYTIRMIKFDLARDLIPLSEFRANASPVLKRLREKGGTLVITHNGKAAAVMLGVEEYQEMLLQIEDLKSMVLNLVDTIDDKKLIPHEEVMKRSSERLEHLKKRSGGN